MVARLLPAQPWPTPAGVENQSVNIVVALWRRVTGMHDAEPDQTCHVGIALTANCPAAQLTVLEFKPPLAFVPLMKVPVT